MRTHFVVKGYIRCGAHAERTTYDFSKVTCRSCRKFYLKLEHTSPAQRNARIRNMRIANFRGTWHIAKKLDAPYAENLQKALDAALVSLGAEPEQVREDKRKLELENYK